MPGGARMWFDRQFDACAGAYDYKAVERGVLGTMRRIVFRVRRRLGLARSADPFATQRRRAYERWLQHSRRAGGAAPSGVVVSELAYRPLISVVMPTYDTPLRFLVEAIESVRAQTYDRWELCVADDASTAPHVAATLRRYAAADSRIKLTIRSENGHISRASNSALELATGEFVALLDHDDRLAPHALAANVAALNAEPDLDLLYSDEDKVDERGRRTEPFFKPGWSPETLLSRMYVGHLAVYRRTILEEIGGFRTGFEGSQDYDLVLRFTERTQHVRHIPEVLYSWRTHRGSAAASADAKPYAYAAAVAALEEALERRGEPGRVERVPGHPGLYVPRVALARAGRASIIVVAGARRAALARCIASIERASTWDDRELVLVHAHSADVSALAGLARKAARRTRLVALRSDDESGYDAGVAASSGEYVVLLHEDTEIITGDWLELMMEQAQRPAIGAVGAKLLRRDGSVDHAGIVVDALGRPARGHHGEPDGSSGYFGELITLNNYSAVSSACLMVRRDVFEAAGGFGPRGAGTDVAFCARIRAGGRRNVYLPHVRLFHDGQPVEASASRTFAPNDPFFSPRLAVLPIADACASGTA